MRVRSMASALAVFGGLAACAAKGEPLPPTPAPVCAPVLWAMPEATGASLSVLGSWDGYAQPGVPLIAVGGQGWQGAQIPIGPGEYGYQIVENGVPRLDDANPLSTFRGDTEVSLLKVDDCTVPTITVADAQATNAGDVNVVFNLHPATGGAPFPPAAIAAKIDGAPAQITNGDTTTVVASGSGFPRGKHRVEITATDTIGHVATAAVSVFVHPKATSWGDGVLYQAVTDRYRGDGGVTLSPPVTPGARAGGTFDGLRAELDTGKLDALGVTALWISPVYVNPTAPQVGSDGRASEGYHGYWPVDSRAVEPRFGGEDGLRALVDDAHSRGLRVLFDIVPNHVHQANALYAAHDDWFSHPSPPCLCGVDACDWATHIDGCWFTSFLPDYRYQDDGAIHNAMDEATYWMDTFDADGVRIDAVPMMPRMASRRIARALRDDRGRADALVLGEVFTGPGQDGIDQIRYRIGPDGLDSAFDFPLLWALRDAFTTQGGFAAVEATLAASDTSYDGSGVVLARILGNHDTTRFISEVVGDAGNDAWTDPAKQPTDVAPYTRMKLALATLLTLPGLPVLYYGDEIGLAGAGDPDTRRVFPDESQLLPPQVDLRSATRRLGTLRGCDAALRSGTRVPLVATASAWAYAREGVGGDVVIVAMSIQGVATISLGNSAPTGDFVDALTGSKVTLDASGNLTLPASGLAVLVPAGSTCLP